MSRSSSHFISETLRVFQPSGMPRGVRWRSLSWNMMPTPSAVTRQSHSSALPLPQHQRNVSSVLSGRSSLPPPRCTCEM